MSKLHDYFVGMWYQPKSLLTTLLSPLTGLYQLYVTWRRAWYQRNAATQTTNFKVPVIVVGNITVGGTGKTPLVVWLAQFLRLHGFRPGIVSRGYGGKSKNYPQQVLADSDPYQMGDEAVLLARLADAPVVIDPNRVNAVKCLLMSSSCDVVISDDGLQHYALGRQIEIAVVDADQRFGNGLCLPGGPLREPLSRLNSVDFIVVTNGEKDIDEYTMQLKPGEIYNLATPTLTAHPDDFSGHALHAIAGIGNPQRFYTTLRSLGLSIWPHSFPDHHQFTEKDIAFEMDAKVIMTEKDAVKCERLVDYRYWCLPVTAELTPTFGQALLEKLSEL
jgi:tetraacyldisaccharide 4'-kinase